MLFFSSLLGGPMKHPNFLYRQEIKILRTEETQIWSLGRDYLLDEEMATHSSILACKIPWTEELGGLQSMGSQRVGHDWATSLSLFPFMRWRRKWQPTPVFLPRESQGWWSLMGCHLWGHTESDMTEATCSSIDLENKYKLEQGSI